MSTDQCSKLKLLTPRGTRNGPGEESSIASSPLNCAVPTGRPYGCASIVEEHQKSAPFASWPLGQAHPQTTRYVAYRAVYAPILNWQVRPSLQPIKRMLSLKPDSRTAKNSAPSQHLESSDTFFGLSAIRCSSINYGRCVWVCHCAAFIYLVLNEGELLVLCVITSTAPRSGWGWD